MVAQESMLPREQGTIDRTICLESCVLVVRMRCIELSAVIYVQVRYMEHENHRIRMEKERLDHATLAFARSFSILMLNRLASYSRREAATNRHSGNDPMSLRIDSHLYFIYPTSCARVSSLLFSSRSMGVPARALWMQC